LAEAADASRLTEGEDVLIGDGPGLNNFYSEWARIVEIDGTTVHLDRRLRRAYAPSGSGRDACIVPGPHMSDITIRDLSIAVPTMEVAEPFGTIRFGLRIRLENVEFAPVPNSTIVEQPLAFVNCGNSIARNLSGSASLQIHASQDEEVQGVMVPGVTVREYSTDLLFDGIRTYRPEGFQCASFNGPGPCERIHLLNSRITNHGDGSSAPNVNFVTDSVISNVQIVQPNHAGTPPAIELEDDNLALSDVTSDSEISVSGQHERIENLTAPHLTLEYSSSGILLTPLLPDPTEITDDTNTAGAWRTPLRARIDGKVQGTGVSTVSLEVVPAETQTADLFQCQDLNGDPLFKIRIDGNLASANSEETGVPQNQRYRLPIYDEADNLLGYIPIHADA
jgi:hypothetical protein